jgi:hypothetical protein
MAAPAVDLRWRSSEFRGRADRAAIYVPVTKISSTAQELGDAFKVRAAPVRIQRRGKVSDDGKLSVTEGERLLHGGGL